VNPVGTNGIYVFDQMMPVWAKEIGVPVRFSAPVRISVEDNQMTKIEGGAEAAAIRGFLEALARRVGETHAYEIRGPHGGVHPHAIVSPAQCPDEEYREFVASFHTGAVHMHLGQAGKSASFPFNCTRRRKRAARRSRSAATCCTTAGGSRSPTIRGEGGGGALRRKTGYSIMSGLVAGH
jgi:hypothetical protein